MPPLNSILQARYRIIANLAAGGMGAVYQALDERLNAIVAVKELLLEGEDIRRAFSREASLLANLNHSALPIVTDHFIEDERHFLVMKYIPGDDLARSLEQTGGPFPIATALQWADQLLDVLEYLHGNNPPIVHRDIKPANLKLAETGKLILLDFGLAKGAKGQMSTWVGGRTVMGFTRNYAPMEQINGVETDPKSDLYSLGATLYHLLTSSIPVDASKRYCEIDEGNPDPLPDAHLINPLIPPDVSAVLKQAMAVRRTDRIQSAREMRQALKQCSLKVRDRSDAVVRVSDPLPEGTLVLPPQLAIQPSPRELKFEYWTKLNKMLRNNNSVVRLRTVKPGSHITGFIGHPQVQLFAGMSIKQNTLTVGLRILNRKDIYRALEKERGNIEAQIDLTYKDGFWWRERKRAQTVSEITLTRQPENINWRERWPEYLTWHCDQLEAFYNTFDPRVRKFPTIRNAKTMILEGGGRSDAHDSELPGQLPISLVPPSPEAFKKELLTTRKARIITIYRNGEEEARLWHASNFSASSNVLGNLRSRPEFRQGNWQELGIAKVRVEIIE